MLELGEAGAAGAAGCSAGAPGLMMGGGEKVLFKLYPNGLLQRA